MPLFSSGAQGFRAEIEGDEELIKKIRSMGKDMEGVLKEAIESGADPILKKANSLAPGPNIILEVLKVTRTHASIKIGPAKGYFYYQFFETGTATHEVTPHNKMGLAFPYLGEQIVRMISNPAGMAAQPFLRPAFDEHKDDAEEATGQTFLKVINRHLET